MSTPRRFVWGLSIVGLGSALGLGSLALVAALGAGDGAQRNGVWITDANTGARAAGAYSRLRVAVVGLLALNRSEAIYFQAMQDADGRRLTADCDYALTGTALDARWWSITAYGADHFLIRSPHSRYSATHASIGARPDGTFRIDLTPEGDGENGIATGRAGFHLTLRLYQPSNLLRATVTTAPLPRLSRLRCRR